MGADAGVWEGVGGVGGGRAGWRAGMAGAGLAAVLGGVEGLLVVLVEVGALGGGCCCDAGS